MAEFVVETDLSHLKTENAALREEVAQLQADKEFVWSLWKRLQVASPDLTQAIAEVVKREKEKAEVKDRKVLQILQVKDSRIEQLEKLVIERNAEIKTLIESKICIEERLTRIQIENQEYSDKLNFQDDQIRSRDNKERTVGHLHKQMVDAFEKEKTDLQKQLSEQNSANNILKAQNADLSAVKSVQETKISSLQQDLLELRSQYDKILYEFEDAKKKVYQHDVDVRQLELQLDYKDKEMANLKNELDEIWTTHQQCKNHAAEQASVINQLQLLQQETQKMLQTQSDSHQIEFQSLSAMYRDVNEKLTGMKNQEKEFVNEIEELKQSLAVKDDRIQELSTGVRERTVKVQTQLSEMDDAGSQVTPTILEQDYKLLSLETERDMLKERLREKNRALKNVQKENVVDLDLDITPVKLCAPHKLTGKDVQIQIKYDNLEKRFRNTQQLLKLKSREVDELRSAHTKRLERLKNVQSNYEIVKNQLKALEEEYYGPAHKEDHKPKRCDAKALRVGDSDKVWNELSFYKQENKALMAERLQLQEDLDICKVQTVQDKAEIHELKGILEQVKEERRSAIEDRDRLLEPDENVALQLQSAKYELFGKESALESVVKEKNELYRRCEILDSERRKLRQELNDASRELAEKRIEVCDVKEQLRKAQKTCRKLKRGRVVRPRKGVVFQTPSREDVREDAEWEVVHETEVQSQSETETDTTLTSVSDAAHQFVPPTRQMESVQSHIDRQRKVETPIRPKIPRSRPVEVIRESVLMKDMATSPHKYNDKVRRTFNTGLRTQMKNVKSRLMNVQEQLKNSRRDKMIAERLCVEQKDMLDSLQKDLLSANQRLRTMRTSHQRLVTENESLLAEKTLLEKKAANVAILLDDKSVASSPRDPADDRKMLESRLKISSAECSKQLLLIKNLRTELEEKDLKLNELVEKVNRLDRDTAQKRLLLEDTRLRLKLSQEQLQANHTVIEELNKQVRAANLSLERQKVNVESAKRRAQASIKEKREYERLYQHAFEKHEDTKIELERTAGALSQMKVKLAAKEREMNEVEEAAHEQMKHTVNKSEAAIEMIQKKIGNYQKRINTYKRFTEGLAQRILRSTQNARTVVTERMNEKQNDGLSSESMKKATDVAKNILNIDQEELEDILGCETAPSQELGEADHKWRENCQKLVNEKGDFSVTLADLMMEKIEEQFRLLSGPKAGT